MQNIEFKNGIHGITTICYNGKWTQIIYTKPFVSHIDDEIIKIMSNAINDAIKNEINS